MNLKIFLTKIEETRRFCMNCKMTTNGFTEAFSYWLIDTWVTTANACSVCVIQDGFGIIIIIIQFCPKKVHKRPGTCTRWSPTKNNLVN